MRISGLYVARLNLLVGAVEAGLFMLAFLLTQRWGGGQLPGSSSVLDLFATVILPSLLLLLTIVAFGIYRTQALRSPWNYVDRLCVAALLGFLVIGLVQSLLFGRSLSFLHLFLAVVGACAVMLGGRGLARLAVRPLRLFRPRALVLGTGTRAGALWAACGDVRPTRLHAFVHGGPDQPDRSDGLPAERLQPLPENLAQTARRLGVDEIVVALDDRRGSMPVEALLDCRMHGIRVVDCTTFLERETGRVDLDGIHPSWLIFSDGFQRHWLGSAIKRGLDILLSLGLLVTTLPLLLLVAVLIKLDSPGPVFYRQARVGQGGKAFWIYKFRSMVADAEGASGAQWAQKADPRVTRVGRLIRRARIDEIPQVLNVLKGEMSFVGPRPERPEFVGELAREIWFYNERHRVKPGLTGWAQINYPYGSSVEDTKEKLKYDFYYLKNRSLLLDLSILLQTMRIVIFGEGAR